MYREGLMERFDNWHNIWYFPHCPNESNQAEPCSWVSLNELSSEEERFKTALENLLPMGQELGFGVPKVPAKPVVPRHRWPDSQ